ncbi:MAG: hypothetical protein R2751_19805 [Bacteroidales bacterium]
MSRLSSLPSCIGNWFGSRNNVRTLTGGFILGCALLLPLSLSSCATTSRASVDSQRRGLLMLENENVYKNKGFYHSKSSNKHRKKVMKAHKRRK